MIKKLVSNALAGVLLSVGVGCGGAATTASGTTTTPGSTSAQGTSAASSAAAASPTSSGVEVPPPAGMVRIPGGTFEFGTSTGDALERPAHPVTLSPYFIHRTEVTVLAYRECHAAGHCSEPNRYDELEKPYCNWMSTGREAHPVNCLDWTQARAYCEYTGGRLPTEAEWEFAARGSDARTYPWGNAAPDDTRLWWSATTPRDGTTTVGSLPGSASAFGVMDMAGNVLEWIGDWHGPFTAGAVTDPSGPRYGETRGVRGGGWQAIRPDWVRATMRDGDEPTARADDLGFRCARSAAL